ncbi:MAG: virulence RhuM family protein [Nanoarchaeota archaeon]|nr:virulence RhuM family protein [Nanoarchaeota archaeon]
MTKKLTIKDEITEFLLYNSPNNSGIKIEVFLHNENVWLTQEKIAILFGVQRPAITKHLINIFKSEELNEDSVSSILEHTASDGKKYNTKFYNLDAIISVGYRVNSLRATQFRIWATKILKEYIIKGFAMDDERLKNPNNTFGKDYFEEQLARIRDIRSSERRFYQKITDIYSQCSADYNHRSKLTEEFFAIIQNKLHWAITGQTAAELISSRANSKRKNMGLKTWKNAPKGKIRKNDISIAKNYLAEEELKNLNRIVSMYLDYAELQAKNKNIMYMKDWIKKLDAFLQFNEQELLQGKGKISYEVAKQLADTEFEKYSKEQDISFESDFDNFAKRSIENQKIRR